MASEFRRDRGLDRAIEAGVLGGSPADQQTVCALQQVRVAVAHDRLAGVGGLLVTDQMTSDGLTFRQSRRTRYRNAIAPGTRGNHGEMPFR